MTTLASQFGTVAQKGTVMGIFRSLGALARAMGPIFASICKLLDLMLRDVKFHISKVPQCLSPRKYVII